MNIRPATETDLPAIARLHQQMHRDLAQNFPPGFGGSNEEGGLTEDLAQLTAEQAVALEAEESVLLVACEADTVIGFLSAVSEEYPDPLLPGGYLTILYVAVDPAFRGQGIAGRLIAEAEEVARARGLNYVDILVWSTNEPAIKSYQQAGYQVLEYRMARRLT